MPGDFPETAGSADAPAVQAGILGVSLVLALLSVAPAASGTLGGTLGETATSVDENLSTTEDAVETASDTTTAADDGETPTSTDATTDAEVTLDADAVDAEATVSTDPGDADETLLSTTNVSPEETLSSGGDAAASAGAQADLDVLTEDPPPESGSQDHENEPLSPHATSSPPRAQANPVAADGGVDVATATPVVLAVATTVLLAGAKIASSGGLAGLYSRLTDDELLENENRQQLVALVEEEPGVSISELADEIGLGWGATVYHLERLEAAGHLASRSEGKRRCFYRPGTQAAGQADALGLLRDERARSVAEHILEHPGATQSDVAEEIDTSSATVYRRVQKLADADLVESEKRGRCVRYEPTARLESLLDDRPAVPA